MAQWSHSLSQKDFEPVSDPSQEGFSLREYIEKLARLNKDAGIGVLSTSQRFSADALLRTFQECQHTLEHFADRNEHRIEKLEEVCQSQEREQAERVKNLERLYQESFQDFQALEDRITLVATKVVHLGDQLESTNNRRSSMEEARDVLIYLNEFKSKTVPTSDVFIQVNRIHEAAGAIVKLNTLANELPPSPEHTEVRKRIADKYVKVFEELKRQFSAAHRAEDTNRMKRFATTLQLFQEGYHKLIEMFVDECLPPRDATYSSDSEMFTQVEILCQQVHKVAGSVFENPEQAVVKFLQRVFAEVVGKFIQKELRPLMVRDTEAYLNQLHRFYLRTQRLQQRLKAFQRHVDAGTLHKMARSLIFEEFLASYAKTEKEHFAGQCEAVLVEYDREVGVKKGEPTLRFPRLRRTEAGPTVQEGEPLVSQDVCTTLIDASKRAIKRCRDLCHDKELAETLKALYFTLLQRLCAGHFKDGLDYALQGIPGSDPKETPSLQFLHTLAVVNQHIHLIDKEFNMKIVKAIQFPKISRECKEQRYMVLRALEERINTGLERTLTAMTGWAKHLLTTHQHKADFKSDELLEIMRTKACAEVVDYLVSCHDTLTATLDGKNLLDVLTEFGIRLFYLLQSHILEYQYTATGGIVLLCDLNEYEKVVRRFEVSLVTQLFAGLRELCNLIIIQPEHIRGHCNSELSSFDQQVVLNFVQLRADYKTAKISKLLQ